MQDDAGGVRVWVPTIPVGWDGADVDPVTLGRGGGEGQHPYLPKIGTYFLLDDDVIDVMQVSPKSLLAPNPELANRYFCPKLNFMKRAFRKRSLRKS